MDHVYKNMQPHPYQKDQMPFGPYYYPGNEAVPPQAYVNPVRPPVNYGCCHWPSNYGYPSPIGCHGCCNHAHAPPHYAWGSPYSHVPPFHCPANYPSFPVQYMPSYGVDHHCCGCSNHQFHPKEQKSVRIEEEEPEKERRKNDSLVPFQLRNTPYPTVWLPPDNINNKEQGKMKDSGDSRDGKSVVQKPASWNGWYPNPLDLSNLVSSKQRGDGEISHQQNDGNESFPFPLFWIPNYKLGEKEQEKQEVKDAISESQKDSGEKDTLLKEGKQREEKESPKKQEKEIDASVKQSTIGGGEKKLDNGEKKLPSKGDKGKSPSPSKSSKLPPVCLRVDPLPRRKAANGSSTRHGDEQKPDARANEPSKVLYSSDNKRINEFKEKKGTKTIEVVDGNTQIQKNVPVNVETPIKVPAESQDNVSTHQKQEKPKEERISTNGIIKGRSEDVGSALEKKEELFKGEEVVADEAKKSRKGKLSEEEAAVIIQSVYRGFDTRKWEPVKKLKQIAKVKEEMANVKHLIQEMEESASDVEGIGKQKTIIAENIMSLLLKLDAIQGLHPSVREIRKLLVRELVSLQERLDSATTNIKPKNPLKEESATKHDDNDVNIHKDATPTESSKETPPDSLEAHQNHENTEISDTNLVGEKESVTKHNDGDLNKDKDVTPTVSCDETPSDLLVISKANLVGEEATDKSENEAAETCMTKNGESSASETTSKNEDEKGNEVLETDVKLTDLEQTDCLELESDLAELPQGVSNDPYDRDNINPMDVGTDAAEASPMEQLNEGALEAPITSEQHTFTADEGSKESVETVLPLSDIKFELEAEESSPINESPASNGIDGDDEFAPDLVETKLEPETGNLEQETGLVNDSANTHEKEDHITGEVKEAVENCGGISRETEPKVLEARKFENEESVEVISEKGEECNIEQQPLPKENLEVVNVDMYESNRKLIEENQKLREIMEKMMKSGQEQLTAISSLSGRVKDLERKLSRKNKLKMRKFRPPSVMNEK